MAYSVGMISLGCEKNRVDAEMMMARLREAGFVLKDDAAGADAAIVNTCGFIESAKAESIEEILELAKLKKEGKIRALIVTGCMAERYREEVRRELDKLLREDMRDPRLAGTFSITRAEVTRDLRYCKVRVSVLEPEKRKDVMAALKSAAGFIRRELGRRVELRYVPELLFEMDTNIEYAAHISEVLKREEEKDERHHP